MKVLINAASANMGGAVTYLQNILRWLPRVTSGDHFTVYVPSATYEKVAERFKADCITFKKYPYANTGGIARIYFDQFGIAGLAKDLSADLVFSSTGFGTFRCPCPQVLLVRNPVYFSKDFHAKYRELGRSLKRNTQRRLMSLWSIRRSDYILFPTLAMQEMVEPYLSMKERPTRAIHYGFDHNAFSQNGQKVPEVVRSIEERKKNGQAILLNVSTYAVHKNFEVLIEALPYLKDQGKPICLVTTTSRERTTDKAEYDALRKRAEELGVADMWIESGYVQYEQLQSLYTVSDLFVFPSFTESFGHSLVESMASGLPVVAADMPVNREVCEEGAVYFSKFSPQACADKILLLLEDQDLHGRLQAQSLNRARHFSWEGYTKELVNLFRELSSN